MYRAHDARARIRDRGRAGVADQRHRLAGNQQFYDACRGGQFVVVVGRHELRANAVRSQERGRSAGVFGRDHVDCRQHVQCPQGDVTQVSERRGDHI